jgi:hypothetical protein
MATAATTFAQAWHIGRLVQEKAGKQRKGWIKARAGTGPNARITVRFTGAPPVTFHPPQLTLL